MDLENECSDDTDEFEYIDNARDMFNNLMAMVNDVHGPFFNPDMFAYLNVDQFVDWLIGADV